MATRSQGPLDDELSVDSASVSSTGTGNGRLDDLALIEVIIDFLSSITDLIGMGGANGIGTVIFRRVKSPPDTGVRLRGVYNLESRPLFASKHQQLWLCLLGLFHISLFLKRQKINYANVSWWKKEI